MTATAQQIDFLIAGLNDPDTTKSWSALVATYATDGATPKAVWEDKSKTLPTVAGKSQFALDSNGQAEVFGDGTYVIKIYDPDDEDRTTPIQTFDSLIYFSLEELVVGPASATNNAIARYDLTTGKLIQDSGATIDDAGIITAPSFVGDITGDATGNADTATTATTATNSLSLGGNLASEYLPDISHDTASVVPITSGAFTELTSIDMGTVSLGSIIFVNSSVKWESVGSIIDSYIAGSGTATFKMNGITSDTSRVRYGDCTPTTRDQNVTGTIEILTTGTFIVKTYCYQNSGGSINVSTSKMSSVYLLKKA